MKFITKFAALAAAVLSLSLLTACSLKDGIGGMINPVTDADMTTKEYTASKGLLNLELSVSSEDTEIIPYDGSTIFVEYYDLKDGTKFNISESGDTLFIKRNSTSFSYIGTYEKADVRIMVPEGILENVDIDVSSGDTKITDMKALSNLRIEASSGDIVLSNLTIKGNLECELSSGDTSISNVSCAGNSSITSSSGDIDFSNFNTAGNLRTETSSGHTIGIAAECNIYEAKSTSGDINVSELTANGNVTAKSSSADITLILTGEIGDFNTTTSTSSGNTNIKEYRSAEATKSISANSSSGDIKIDFGNNR